MKLHTDLDGFNQRILGHKKAQKVAFFEDKKFAETQYDEINKQLLRKSMVVHQQALDTSNVLNFFEQRRFSNEDKTSLHENFFWSFDSTINHIDQMMISFNAQCYDGYELMKYIQELFEDINQHHAQKLFPCFETVRYILFENPDVASFKAAIDKAYPEINLRTGNRQTLDFLKTPTHFESYKSVFLLYKIWEAALIIFHYDRRQEDQIDGYYRHTGADPDEMHREEKKAALCDRINATLTTFTTQVFGERSQQPITSPDLQKYLLSTSVVLSTSFRFKSEASKIRKTLLRKEYPNQIYDYTGAHVLIHLPELEALLDQALPPKITEQVRNTIFTIKYDIAQEVIAYLPSLLGNYADSKTRVRAYLSPAHAPKESSQDYQALHFSFYKFVVDDYPFDIPLEFQLVLDYGSHETMRSNQFERMAEMYYQQATMEQVVREEVKYQVDPSEDNYIKLSKYNTKALNPFKLANKGYKEEMQDLFRKQNAQSHLVELYVKCNEFLFKQLFTYNKELFDSKVTGLTDEKIISLFGKNKFAFVKSQIPTFGTRILQREYDYIIKPVQEKLQALTKLAKAPKKKSAVGDVHTIAKKKLAILGEYIKAIKEQYHIQTR